MEKLTKKGLDGTQLKTIALVLMVLDHIHYFFEFTGCIPTVFSMLGRLSAPLFLFCTVEGFAHTHDRRRYFIRIWAIGAAMAALEFFMIYAKAFRRGDGFYPQNAIFQDLVLLCIVWQGIDWLREKKFAKGIGAIAAVLCWPYVVVVFLLLFPGVQEMPIASTIVAFVITSPLPMWTTITDGGWSFLLGGVLLYALRGRRKVQLTVWALVIFLCDFALTFGMACRQEGFVWTQMFTDYYEWFGVAAVLLMLLTLAFVFFGAQTGLLWGLRLPNLTWTNETAPIKQGAATALALLTGWAAVLLLAGGYILLHGRLAPEGILALAAALLTIVNVLLRRRLQTVGTARFASLQP